MLLDRRLLENFDWVLFFLVCLLSVIGFFAIYSASISYEKEVFYLQKQILWFIVGLLVMLAATTVNYKTLGNFSLYAHLLVIVLLVLVLFFGTGSAISRVRRWLPIGPFYIQPSEFVKFTLALYLAHYFRDPRRVGEIGFKKLLWPLVVTIVPFVLILRQPDLGTSLLLFAIFIPVIFLAGIRYKVIIVSVVSVLLALPFAWVFLLKPYMKDRILTLINPDRDPLGKGYHIIQSKISVGSGGLWGKGFLEGTQARLGFLPARHTDFIFSVFAEEWGFIGSLALLALYSFFIYWCVRNVGSSKARSGTILTIGITSIFVFHILINIGMVLGLFPVVGMPLPFMSYGGSAMISMMAGVGILLNIRMRKFEE